VRFSWSGFLLGLGAAAAIDGILLHQVLQWHHLVMQADSYGRVLSDGLLHAGSVGLLLAGTWLLWRAGRRGELPAPGLLGGSILAGAGLFHVADSLVNHFWLQLHHIKPGGPDQLTWDLLFLAAGLLMLAGSWRTLSVRR
jgi:uncharacterized membrane protein